MKKILVIHGSPRKKTTYGLTKQIEELMAGDFEFEHILLKKMNIRECYGCLKCVKTDNCAIKDDDIPAIIKKMRAADGIIFSSPVYMFTVTGIMKSFIDRLIVLYHRPVLIGKPAMIVTSAEGSPINTIETYLNKVIWSYGMASSDTVWRNAMNKSQPVQAKEFKKFRKLLDDNSHYKPSLPNMIMFKTLKIVSLVSSDMDTQHWNAEGLYDRDFYFESKINRLKMLIADFVYYKLSKKLKGRIATENRHLIPLAMTD